MADEARYERTTLPTPDGDLTVGTWGTSEAPAVIALHGVTSTHQDFGPLAEAARGHFKVVAPDLRGRGGSSDISGPWGMDSHVSDVIAILDAEGIERGVLVGHSMGAFVAVLAAVQHPDRIRGLVLVDGGIPAVEANAGGDELTRIVLGAARARLEMRFPTPEVYIDWVRAGLPADAALTAVDEQVLRYDLTPIDDEFRVAGSYPAIAADAVHITGEGSAAAARRLERPAILLRAGRGLPPRTEGLYSPREVAEWTRIVPALTSEDILDVDHGTIIRDTGALKTITDAAARMLAVAD